MCLRVLGQREHGSTRSVREPALQGTLPPGSTTKASARFHSSDKGASHAREARVVGAVHRYGRRAKGVVPGCLAAPQLALSLRAYLAAPLVVLFAQRVAKGEHLNGRRQVLYALTAVGGQRRFLALPHE